MSILMRTGLAETMTGYKELVEEAKAAKEGAFPKIMHNNGSVNVGGAFRPSVQQGYAPGIAPVY